jgi:snRNA-activating protein complex subunit 3
MSNGTLPQTSSKPDALLTITIHNPISWSRGHVSRASQHVVLASQTLGNLFDVIPCTSNELPEELAEDDVLVGYDAGKRQTGRGCVICIENVAYGDGQSGQDYAECVALVCPCFPRVLIVTNSKLLLQLEKIPPEKRPELRKSPAAMHDTTWKSLSVRINQPYWFLHRGNCEHYVVIDQIRPVIFTALSRSTPLNFLSSDCSIPPTCPRATL